MKEWITCICHPNYFHKKSVSKTLSIVCHVSRWKERRTGNRSLLDRVLLFKLCFSAKPGLNNRQQISWRFQLFNIWYFFCSSQFTILYVCQMSCPCLQSIKNMSCIYDYSFSLRKKLENIKKISIVFEPNIIKALYFPWLL